MWPELLQFLQVENAVRPRPLQTPQQPAQKRVPLLRSPGLGLKSPTVFTSFKGE